MEASEIQKNRGILSCMNSDEFGIEGIETLAKYMSGQETYLFKIDKPSTGDYTDTVYLGVVREIKGTSTAVLDILGSIENPTKAHKALMSPRYAEDIGINRIEGVVVDGVDYGFVVPDKSGGQKVRLVFDPFKKWEGVGILLPEQNQLDLDLTNKLSPGVEVSEDYDIHYAWAVNEIPDDGYERSGVKDINFMLAGDVDRNFHIEGSIPEE